MTEREAETIHMFEDMRRHDEAHRAYEAGRARAELLAHGESVGADVTVAP